MGVELHVSDGVKELETYYLDYVRYTVIHALFVA